MSTSSRLLRLPAELRNHIYRLALISPDPLMLASNYDGWDTLLPSEIDGITREHNQLKYVNKQIFMEIENTELNYNDIMVKRTKPEDEPPATRFLSWAYSMMSSTRSWLDGATIVLADESAPHHLSEPINMPDSARTMSHLAEFCDTHTAVTVHYHLPDLNFAIDDEYREKDSLGSLRFNIRESALAAYFYVPALIAEDVELGPTFNRWFQGGKVDEMVSDAEDWKLKQKGYFSVEDLQAENIYYFMVSDCFTTQ
jgi:hypothetical protein